MANYKIISNMSEFKEIQNQWNKLFQKIEDISVFQSFDWNYYWSQLLDENETLFIIIFYGDEAKDVYAILPLYIDTKFTLRFIADSHSDYCSFIIDNSIKNLHAFYKDFFELVNETNSIKKIDLINFQSTSTDLSYLATFPYGYSMVSKVNASSKININPLNKFPHNFLNFIAKDRNRLKKLEKKFSFTKHKIYKNNNGDNFPIERVLNIINNMKKRGIRNDNFINEIFLKLISKLYESNILVISEIVSDDEEPLAISFVLVQPTTHYFWIDLYEDINSLNGNSYFFCRMNLFLHPGILNK